MAESSTAPPGADKPVIVRVKRKASQSALDAFWLEINERPLKRPLIDFGKLSISDASSSKVEEFKTQKILVRHVETVTSSKDTFDVLRSVVPNSSGELKSEEKIEERRRSLKTVDKQDQLLVKARQAQEVLSRYARFEQIWRSRKEKIVAPEDEAIYDMCRLYDVVRVDVEELAVEVQNQKDTDMDDCKMMADFLPLLREVLPTAAEEIEHDIHGVVSNQDGYVYDVYAVEKDVNEMEADSTSHFPLVQVDDDEQFYDGPDDSECETDDSNAENNPLNDYPDEEDDDDDDEDEDEATSRSSDENSEDESTTSGNESEELKSGSQVSYEYEGSELYEWSDYADQTLEDSDGDEESYYFIVNDLMEDNSTIPFDQFKLSSNSQIPFDLFVSKKYKGIGIRGFVRFTDSARNLVYTVQKSSYKSATRDQDCVKQLLDSSGNTLFLITRINKRSWHGFKGNGEEKKVIFTADKTVDEFSRTEFTVILVDENNEDAKTELRMKGSPYKRSCTIYKCDSIVAQNKAQLVVIAHDVDPIELVVWLPALCRKMEIPYCIVILKIKFYIVHKKTASVLCLTSVKNEDKMEFSKILEAIKADFNDKYDETRKKWGGGVMGSKSQAKTKAKERVLAKEAAQRLT
ncbi:RNA-directed DNA methylation 4 [Perilla frutescens var. frutescens]|nr:RNA-directed DNA methylation 4 [Perilla frutescens var. frutescens]